MKEIKICCKKFKKQIERYGGSPFEVIGNDISVNGCCGGGCYVITDLLYCPWCGKKFKLQ